MSAESILGAFGLENLLALDFVALQLVVMAATGALFAMTLVLMLMAARSAGGARKARRGAEEQFRHAQDFVVEARQLSAQIERAAATRPAPSMSSAAPPIRVGARETTAEAEVEIIDSKHGDGAGSSAERKAGSRNLAAAKESATIPKRLLGRSPRRL